MRFFQRMLTEHRRLPRLVRIFRTWQAVSIALLIACIFALPLFRLPLAVMSLLMLVPLMVLSISVFGVGLLTWKNYQKTAEIWADNVRGRGLDSIGIGWLVDIGTVRAMGAAKAIFMAVFGVAALIQTLWR